MRHFPENEHQSCAKQGKGRPPIFRNTLCEEVWPILLLAAPACCTRVVNVALFYPPGDAASFERRNQSRGPMFHQISTGRGNVLLLGQGTSLALTGGRGEDVQRLVGNSLHLRCSGHRLTSPPVTQFAALRRGPHRICGYQHASWGAGGNPRPGPCNWLVVPTMREMPSGMSGDAGADFCGGTAGDVGVHWRRFTEGRVCMHCRDKIRRATGRARLEVRDQR